MSRPVVIGAFSDTHCGHDVGLTPDSYNWQPAEAAIAREHKQFAWRQASWAWFISELKKVGKLDIAIWNGDIVDGTGEKSGGTEDQEMPMQAKMATEIVHVVGAEENYFVRGTPYHTGKGKMTWEDVVASNVQSETIGDEGQYDINGLIINAKHKISNSSSPISQFTALSSVRIRQLLWSDLEQQKRANLLLRAHIHRCESISEPARNFAAWSMPALQGLGSIFGARGCDGLPVHFGFLVIRVNNVNDWGVEAHIAPMKMQKASTVVYRRAG